MSESDGWIGHHFVREFIIYIYIYMCSYFYRSLAPHIMHVCVLCVHKEGARRRAFVPRGNSLSLARIYINNNCRANNKPGGARSTRSIARNCWFPYSVRLVLLLLLLSLSLLSSFPFVDFSFYPSLPR